MKKLICVCVLAALCLCVFAGCQCEHQFADADCVTPKTCTECGETEGEALGHTWADADCVTPKTCTVCKATEGEALGHTWVDADCVTPKTCTVCKATEGEALGHTWVDADCVTAKTCSVCAATEGEPAGHTWVDATCTAPKTCSVCTATEGEMIDHTWVDATTEAPKTCSVCAATEGKRIITDERFTTAACSGLFGTWKTRLEVSAADMGFSDGDEVIVYLVTMKFYKDGTMAQVDAIEDPEHAEDLMVNMMVNMTYTAMEAQGYTKAQTDAEFVMAYGMTVEEFYRSYIAAMGGLAEPTVTEMVYYVDGSTLYVALDWAEEMVPLEFTLEGDTMTMIVEEGKPEVYTRVAEAE